jgi:hypothetical protein
MKTKKLLWLLLIVATIAAAFAFTVSATDSASEPTLKIEGGNLSFEDSVFILYAVSHEGIAAEDVRLYFWNEPQSGENAYAYDTADYSFAPYQQNVIVAEKSCVTFRNNTLRAKNMTDYVYARAYAEVDGVGYYSEVSKYSILQYAYNQLGKTAARDVLKAGGTLPYCESEKELDNITAKLLCDYARMGEETALSVYRKSGEMLGKSLAILVDLLNPERIIIGSIFARAEDLLRPHMEKTLKEEAIGISLEKCQILPALLGDEIGDYAALAVAETKGYKQNEG